MRIKKDEEDKSDRENEEEGKIMQNEELRLRTRGKGEKKSRKEDRREK